MSNGHNRVVRTSGHSLIWRCNMYRLLRAVLITVLASFVLFAGQAAAEHEHWIQTPGTCVENVARGQTAKAESEPGGHQFHYQVHLGQPGSTAFGNTPVSVGKGTTCP